tara:strand:- start:65772 stop:66167 length:396 start_codon:yes stop_codon:yes gene_type:complete
MPQEGWEFFILDPTDKNNFYREKNQEIYKKMYLSAYQKLMEEICIPNPNDLFQSDENCTFLYYINCQGDSDIINLDENYEYKFLKSTFLDKKFVDIKKRTYMYYNAQNIYVKSMYKNGYDYFIELKKNRSE